MSRQDGGRHATLYDFRDLDLMLKIEAESDPEGWVEATHMASAMGFGDETTPVARRFSWMKHYGMLEYDPKTKLWRLSPGGKRVAEARLRSATSRQIAELPDESLIEVMSAVTDRYWKGDPMTAVMLRREFAYGTKRRAVSDGRNPRPAIVQVPRPWEEREDEEIASAVRVVFLSLVFLSLTGIGILALAGYALWRWLA